MQACERFDSGVVSPARAAQNTFLIIDGKRYPAKFIRGLAYQVATGTVLNPSRDYSGGVETVRFFKRLGLTTEYNSTPVETQPFRSNESAKAKHTESNSLSFRDPQKQEIAKLLQKLFGVIQTEKGFPWLVVPSIELLDDKIGPVRKAIGLVRGITDFSTPGCKLRFDFCIENKQLVIEYDERQHFTQQRAAALKAYPDGISVGFDMPEWIVECHRIKATDPSPSHRDEQRAYYDSVRDILASANGYRIVRIRSDLFDWKSDNAEQELRKIVGIAGVNSESQNHPIESKVMETSDLTAPEWAITIAWGFLRRDPNNWVWDKLVPKIARLNHPAIFRPLAARLRERYGAYPNASQFNEQRVAELVDFVLTEADSIRTNVLATRTVEPTNVTAGRKPISKIGLVSHNYNVTDQHGRWDYSEIFHRANKHCDKAGCDTVLYGLYSWDRRSLVQKSHDSIFAQLKNVDRVILEVGDLYPESRTRWAGDQVIEILHRGINSPMQAWQWFATTADMNDVGLVNGLLNEISQRVIDESVLVICGESGIFAPGHYLQRFMEFLKQANVRLIFNPTHDYMKPFMGNDYFRTRMMLASQDGQNIVSVWNQGKRGEPIRAPWCYFHNGQEKTDTIQEIPNPIPERPDVRIGICQVKH
jgi:very-short-patch-repair endonuclease